MIMVRRQSANPTRSGRDTCAGLRIGTETLPFDDGRRAPALRDAESLTGEALRTIGVAYRPLGPGEESIAG